MLLCGVLRPARLTSWEASAAATQNRKRQEKLAVLNFNPFLGTEMVIFSSAFPGALQNQIQLPELLAGEGCHVQWYAWLLPGYCLYSGPLGIPKALPCWAVMAPKKVFDIQ